MVQRATALCLVAWLGRMAEGQSQRLACALVQSVITPKQACVLQALAAPLQATVLVQAAVLMKGGPMCATGSQAAGAWHAQGGSGY